METSRPHTAVINVRFEIHALDDLGQCSGRILNDATLEAFGLKSSMLFSVNGIDAEDCINKLKKKLELLND